MSTIAASTGSTPPLPAPPTTNSTDAASSGQGGDLLAAMNPAMEAAFAVGRPTDKNGAAAILATTGAYVAGAHATIDKLDEGIQRRERELEQLRISDPDAAADKQGQLDLLKQLRDRIQLSIERVTRTAAGGDDEHEQDPIEDTNAVDERLRKIREQEALLEQRRVLLAPQTIAAPAQDSSTVAGTYAATAARAG